jgi:hypothetical protein
MLNNGVEVSCRKCWQCRKRRVDDLVGRCIAESKFAKRTYAATLTYGGEAGVNAATLVYKDVQDFLKRLRKKYSVRYIVAGEYGTKKNRAHWHVILFFNKQYPEVENNKRVNWEYWTKGFSYFQEPDWKGFQYVLKYVLKDQDERVKVGHLAMSKKPPLGEEYFKELAKQHVKEMILPRNIFYKFRDVRNSRNKIKDFCMQGKTKDMFMRRIRWRWYKKYGKEPMNELFEEYFENETRREEFDVEMETKRLHYKPVKYGEKWHDKVLTNDHWTKADVTEVEYQGILGILWEHKDVAEVYTEQGEWQKVEKHHVKQIKQFGKVITRRKYDEVLREQLENT